MLDARPTALTLHSLVHSPEDQINILQPFPKRIGALMLRLWFGTPARRKAFLGITLRNRLSCFSARLGMCASEWAEK